MDSPVSVPYRSFISIDRQATTPVYLQLVHQFIHAIQRGYLPQGHKLPGSRKLSTLLGVHRNTVVAGYAELDAQGWIDIMPNRGTFVCGLKTTKPLKIKNGTAGRSSGYPQQAGFPFRKWTVLDNPFDPSAAGLVLDDGLPDTRLSHVSYLSRLYHINMKRRGNLPKLGYNNRPGSTYYKENLANFLNLTRGLHIADNNLLVTRSLELSVYIVAETLLSPGDQVVVGELSYFATNMIFQKAGARILTVPVDDDGLDVRAVEKLCQTRPFRMLYITSHHHYPTTAAFSAQRRSELLALSAKYRFIILEDDYDYDFHFGNSPLLPMASADTDGMVVYVGTFGKSMAAGFRSGFIVAPAPLINEMAKLLSVMDRYGDILTELALGELITDGEIHRYLRKANKEYRLRRDHCVQQLQQKLVPHVTFSVPNGGLAIWTRWPEQLNLMQFRKICSQHDLYIPRFLLYQSRGQAALRLGFGSLRPEELDEAFAIMKESLDLCL